ncbi:MAG TPA: Clp protease N-terminal domain-containing protein [Candidatus Limnocylindrales bacterium]|nr:Clp protease N-terminal domain-containing protein [Candidatus Limnocylindrales bacterium]
MSDPWTEAWAIAKELDVSYVGTDMLLMALTRTDGMAADVLAAAGATEAAVAGIVTQTNRPGAIPADPQADPAHRRLTPAANVTRGRAEGLGIALGIADGSVRLLLALAYDRNGVHSSVLHHLGVDRGALVQALADRGVPVPATPPAPDRTPHLVWVTLPDEQARVVVAELARRSTEDMEHWFDAWGNSSWGYGGVDDERGDARIYGEERIDLRKLVPEILAASGYPPPPEDAWEIHQDAS